MSTVAFIGLWLFAFVVPWELFIRFEEIGTLGRLAGLVAFAVAILNVLLQRAFRPPALFHLFAFLFVLWSGATAFWTMDQSVTRERFATYVQLAAVVWLIWELAPTPRRQASILQAYVLGSYVSAFDTIANYVSGIERATGRFAAEGFNPNDLGFTLVLAIPMAWFLANSRPYSALTWVNRLYIPFGMAAILLTASRGAFIPALVALLIIPATLLQVGMRSRIAVFVVIAASVIFLNRFVPRTSWDRLSTATSEIESGSFNERSEIWRSGLEVFGEHQWVGVGAGAFGIAIEPILGHSRPPHQTFLSVLVGQGIVGFALFLTMFATAVSGIRAMPTLQKRFWIVLLLTLGVGLQPRTWDYRKPLWLILGVLAAQGASARQGGRESRRRDRATGDSAGEGDRLDAVAEAFGHAPAPRALGRAPVSSGRRLKAEAGGPYAPEFAQRLDRPSTSSE